METFDPVSAVSVLAASAQLERPFVRLLPLRQLFRTTAADVQLSRPCTFRSAVFIDLFRLKPVRRDNRI